MALEFIAFPAQQAAPAGPPFRITTCRQRGRIDRCCHPLEHVRRFATRCDRHTIRFAGFVQLAAAMIRMQ